MSTELALGVVAVFLAGTGAIYVLVKAIASLGNNIIRWSRAMDEHEQQRQNWSRERDAFRDEVNRLEATVARLTSELGKSTAHQISSDTRITLLEQQLIERDNRIMALEADVKRLRGERETLAREKEQLSARVVSLEYTVEELQAKLAATSTGTSTGSESIIVIGSTKDTEDQDGPA